MKNVSDAYGLFLDTKTDMAHLISMWDDRPILTFDAVGVCTNDKGEVVCRITTKDGNWVTVNDFQIETKPVTMSKVEGIFDVEADFCEKWLEKEYQKMETK